MRNYGTGRDRARFRGRCLHKNPPLYSHFIKQSCEAANNRLKSQWQNRPRTIDTNNNYYQKKKHRNGDLGKNFQVELDKKKMESL